MTHRLLLTTALLVVLSVPAAAQTRGSDTGTLMVGVAREVTAPIPTLWGGDVPNREASDLIFLRLADLGPQLKTDAEQSFLPRLARKWTRPDPRTLVFELDPRAKWQDGAPVVAADVVFAIERARNPTYGSSTSSLLRRIASVTADGPTRVRFQFTTAYAEQMYDAVYHVPPLPSHLLSAILPDSLATSAFVSNPIGNGPYRMVRRVPQQFVELQSQPDFFLGRPRIERVLFQLVGSPEARANMLAAGEIDAVDNVYALPDPAQVNALPGYRYFPTPGGNIAYINFNQRDPADTSRPHPVLADPAVRRALVLLVNRERIGRSAMGPYTVAPSAPISAIVGRNVDAPPPLKYDVAAGRQLLASRGWKDTDGDSILDRDGKPLALTLIVPSTSGSRKLMATQLQEAYRQAGVALRVELVESRVYMERRDPGRFDLEFWSANQDPTPTGLVQSWSCASPPRSNPGHYCDRTVDSLIAKASASPTPVPAVWREVARRMAEDQPAIFMGALVPVVAVHRRFEHVTIRPESMWADVWQWSVKPGAQLERDRP